MKALAGALAAAVLAIALTACARNDASQIRGVIEKLDHEQEQAFAAKNPKLMADSSTAQNLSMMIQANDDLVAAGASSIHLSKIEWGDVVVTSGTTAKATTWETWDTTFSDGTTMSTRERNDYQLVKVGDAWVVDGDDHPEPPDQAVTPSETGTPALSGTPARSAQPSQSGRGGARPTP